MENDWNLRVVFENLEEWQVAESIGLVEDSVEISDGLMVV
jgi:hypothetical protein